MHKIGLKILLGWALFLPITAYSLGLGDIDVKSFLNQPLRAEISVISARPGEIDDLLVGLANREAFTRASLSRPSHLSDLKFKVIKSEDGTSAVISIQTQTAVKEPVLNFLVEADWAKGKVFREFTILLDPPYFAQQAAAPVKTKPTSTPQPVNQTPKSVQPVATPQEEEPVQQPEPIVNSVPTGQQVTSNDDYVNESAITEEYNYDLSSVEPSPIPEVETTVESPSVNTTSSSDEITITDGATLWSVAKSLKTDGVSMSQVMLALQRLNQDAFGNNNINNLKQGAVLRVPTEADYSDLSQRDAYIEVLNQNGLWNDYLASVGHASANPSNTQQESSNSTSGGEETESALNIVASGEGDSDKAALRSDENEAQVATLRKQLLLSEEEAESLKIERDDLASRVQALEAELDKRNELQNLVTIEDNTLANMEQGLANEQSEQMQPEQPVEIVEEVTEVTEEIVQEVQNDVVEEEQVQEVTGVMESAETVSEETMTSNESTTESEEVAETDVVNGVEEVTNEGPSIIVEEPAPIIVSESSSSSNLVDDIIAAVLTNPIVQGAIAGVLLLVLLVTKFLQSRKNKEPESEESDSIEDSLSDDPIDTQSGIIIPNVDEDETPINVPQMEENQPVDDFASTVSAMPSIEDGEDEDEFSKTAIISADDMAAMETQSESLEEEDAEQDETLDEVDVYLAYSLFENAEDLLKEKLTDSPDRADYRAKLLDTYYATQNKDAFVDEASSLKSLGNSANKYWPRVQTMGYELDPSNPMFAEGEGGDVGDLTIAKPEMADFDIGAEGESTEQSDFDLSLDGDDTDFNLSEDDGGNDLEFNLDEELNDTSDNEAVDSSADDELPDDLGGLDFDLDEPEELVEETIEAADSTDVDDGLEFNLDDDLSSFDANENLSAEDSDLESIEATSVIETDDIDEIEKTAAIETDDLEFAIDELEEDVQISLDDVEPDLDIDSDADELELDLSADTLDSDSIDDASEMTDTMVIAPDDFSDANEEIEIDLNDDDSSNVLGLDDDEISLNIDSEDDVNLSLDETTEMAAVEMEESVEEVVDDLTINETVVLDEVSDDLELDISDSALEEDFNLDDDITDIGNIEGLMLPDDVDEVATKLDLAKAFQDMGDAEGARSSLEEVLQDGNDAQKAEAEALLKTL